MRKSNGGFTYLGVHNYGVVERKMEHLVSYFLYKNIFIDNNSFHKNSEAQI